uniref:BRO1 domain-containing protein n=1 Tax=Timema bartmani TaxID=61472 RepID=A0A7R9F454_9NEOP|nr:unnamed protein product [Timema bartmani]
MSHWFHRNVLKATAHSTFETKMIAQDCEALKVCSLSTVLCVPGIQYNYLSLSYMSLRCTSTICSSGISDLKASRYRLLELLPDPRNSSAAVESALDLYLALLNGLVTAPQGGPSKLRHNFLFKWTHSLLGNTPQLQQDTVFESANIICNVAIWFMKHAAMIAVKDDIDMEEAKEVHKSLRRAAGMFRLVQKELVPHLSEKPMVGGDLDPRVTTAYFHQCTAEAQEVTVARAIELKHNASLISALANETSKLFGDAAGSLVSIEGAERWHKYLRLKSVFYQAYAYSYCGDNLLSLDQCGAAIRALQESYAQAEELCKEYRKVKGLGPKARPETHPFFKRLSPIVRLTLEKCERENGFIYHQKVPVDPPELELKATYGLVSPEEFVLPPTSPLWTPVVYAALDQVKSNPKDPANSSAAAKVEGDLTPVPEVPLPQSGQEPKNESGCVLQ